MAECDKINKSKKLIQSIYLQRTKDEDLFSKQCVGYYDQTHVKVRDNDSLCKAVQKTFCNKKMFRLEFGIFHSDNMNRTSCVIGSYKCCWTENELCEKSLRCHIIVFFVNDKITYFRIVSEKTRLDYIWLTGVDESRYKIRLKDIMFLESLHNHVRWNTKRIRIETVDLLKSVQNILPENFVRIHRGYIVNSDHICCLERCKAFLTDGTEIPIPKNKYTQIRNELS